MSATNGHNLVAYQDKNSTSTHLVETLQRCGAAVQLITELDEAPAAIVRLFPAIFVVSFGTKRSDGEHLVSLLTANTALHAHPLLLVGKNASSFEEAIGKDFCASMTLNAPYAHNELLEALAYITRQAPAEIIEESQILDDSGAQPATIAEAGKELPKILFSQLAELRLPNGSLEGDKYFRRINEDLLRERGFLAGEEKVAAAIQGVCHDAGAWGAAHLYRLSFLSGKVTHALSVAEPVQRSGHIAAFLFAWSFAGSLPKLLKANYTGTNAKSLRKDLCSRVKDSAMKIAMELKLEEAAQIVSTLGKLIAKEEPVHDDAQSVVASAIMAADLVDRICFPRGIWESTAAYPVLRALRAGTFEEFHPLVLCCVVKFLSEAISAQPTAPLLPKRLRDDPALRKAHEQTLTAEVSENEKKVEVASLQPGMKLTKPLMSYDGREILSADLVLDQDLIWRLWQLSAIRPLNAPLVVNSEN